MGSIRRRLLAGAPAFVRRFSTAVQATEPLEQTDCLYRRLSKLWRDKGTVASTIDDYISEGKSVGRFELHSCINGLRKYRRFDHALEIMEWMEFQKFNFGPRDYAVRLELIAKVKGTAEAENYFSSLTPSMRVHGTYGALLNSYCQEKMTGKALGLFCKMFKENMILKPLPFNHLMTLYMRSRRPKKVVSLFKNMKKMNVWPDTNTYNLVMKSYAYFNQIQEVERVFEEMKLENGKLCNWTSYSCLANIYVRAGYQEKAELALTNVEEMGAHDRMSYQFLISFYAGLSDLDNVHRVWEKLKSTVKVVTNMNYLIMLQALGDLNDVEGMKKCFEEWESVCCSYDIRLVYSVIGAYLIHDMVEEAESVLQRASKKTDTPLFKALEMFMVFYLKKGQIKQALEIMEMAASKFENNEWRPKPDTITRFLDYFKQENDVSGAEEFYELMKRMNCVDSSLYKSLLETYQRAGRTMFGMKARIEKDGVEMSSKLEHLLTWRLPLMMRDWI